MFSSKEEALLAIMMIAERYDLFTIVIRDQNPDFSLNCYSPFSNDIDVQGSIRGEQLHEGSSRLISRVLSLELHLNDGISRRGDLPN